VVTSFATTTWPLRSAAKPRSSASGPFDAPLQALIGEGLLDGKKYVEAAKAFQDAAAKTPFAADKDVYTADAARALTLAGKTEDAKKLWSELAAKRESPVLAEARRQLATTPGTRVTLFRGQIGSLLDPEWNVLTPA
jgi:hypothetical protein